MTGIARRASGLTRTEALDATAKIIARSVPDLAGLAMLLDLAGMTRLATALRAKIGAAAEIGGKLQPDMEIWNAQAERTIGGKR